MDFPKVPNAHIPNESEEALATANRPMTNMPEFRLGLTRGINDAALLLTCSIVGDPAGVRAVPRKFESSDELEREFGRVGISAERYDQLLGDEARSVSIQVDLNEAQRLSVIQTDSTE